jgi:hypothetical protein
MTALSVTVYPDKYLYRYLFKYNMARFDLTIDDKLDQQFRDTIYKKYGMKKGNLRIALEEAIRLWIDSEKESRKK